MLFSSRRCLFIVCHYLDIPHGTPDSPWQKLEESDCPLRAASASGSGWRHLAIEMQDMTREQLEPASTYLYVIETPLGPLAAWESFLDMTMMLSEDTFL